MKRFVSLITVVALALGTLAAGRPAEPRPSQSALDDDRSVVSSIVMSAVSEVNLCSLVLERSHDAQVRSLCRSSSAESARIAIDGMQLAARIGAAGARLQPLPSRSDELGSLSQHGSSDFDRSFIFTEIRDAQSDEDNLRYAIEVASQASVRRLESFALQAALRRMDAAESALRRLSEATP